MAANDSSTEGGTANEVDPFQLLTTINNQVSDTQFEQATLCLHCLGLGGEDLDAAREVTDLYMILSSDQPNLSDEIKTLAIPILQCVLLTVGVSEAVLFHTKTDEKDKAKKMLMFPSLLVELCKRLGAEDFRSFKNGICLSVLKCNPSKITSRAELMKKLLQQKAIEASNLDVLIKWLKLVRRNDLVTKVDTYSKNLEVAKKEEKKAPPQQSADSANTGVDLSLQLDSPGSQGVNLSAQTVNHPTQVDSPSSQRVNLPPQVDGPSSQRVNLPTVVDSPSSRQHGLDLQPAEDTPVLPPGRSLSTEASDNVYPTFQELVTGASSTCEPSINQTRFFTVQEAGEPEVATLDQRVTQIAQEVGVPGDKLNVRVLATQLKRITEFLPENWQQFDWLPEDANDSLEALRKWHSDGGNEATYKFLVEKLLSAHYVQAAEKICPLAMRLNVRFCQQGAQPMYVYNTPAPVACPQGTLPGPVPMNTLWDITKIRELKVHFMNPDVLKAPGKHWRCGHNELEQLTTETVLAWATRGWNKDDPKYKCVPKISRRAARDAEDSHIRVAFGTDGVCWSYVGRKAHDHEKQVTMYLNLYNYSTEDQESLVLHEFGHALGLEHEHQRSDVWEVLREVCDGDKLKELSPEHQSFTAAQERGDRVQLEYDPDSIMHYWMDHKWLRSQYRNLKEVKKMTDLSPQKRKVIEGVHKRDYRDGLLAREPSRLDLEALRQAYERQSTRRESFQS